MHAFLTFSAKAKTSMLLPSFVPTFGYCNHLCGFTHRLVYWQKNCYGNTCALQCKSVVH